MNVSKTLLIALAAGIVSFGAQAQSSDDSKPNGATPVPEAKSPMKAKKTRAEKHALTAEAEKSGAGSDSAEPNGSAPVPEAKFHKKPKKTKEEKKELTSEAEKSGAGSNSATPNGAAPTKK